jgi:hypothetical protein
MELPVGTVTTGVGMGETSGHTQYTNTWPNSTVSQFVTWPSYCSGNVHVWACDHQTACKCGRVSRVVSPPACLVCGQ